MTRLLLPDATKVCSMCKEELPVANFSPGGKTRKYDSRCRKCRSAQKKEAYWRNPEKYRGYQRRYGRKIRREALEVYGNGACVCCGETYEEFLAIDHIDGKGGKQRKESGRSGGNSTYQWLKSKGWPKGYRVLCHNCNLSRGFYGYCPHEREDD